MSALVPDITQTPTKPYIAGSHIIETPFVCADILHSPPSLPDIQLQRPSEVSPRALECRTQYVTVASPDSAIPGSILAKQVEGHQNSVIS